MLFTILLASLAWGILLFVLLLACWGRVLHSKGPSKVAALAAEIDAVVHSAGTIEEKREQLKSLRNWVPVEVYEFP